MDKRNYTVEDKIKLRNNWLKIALTVVAVGILGYKCLTSEFDISLGVIDLNDILSLIIAIFSICLAIAFYFKACDSSNSFYDNTYKFTKDVSTILSRIESGFGEQLSHLDRDYTNICDKMSPSDKIEVESKIEDDSKKVEKITKERNDLLDKLVHKDKLNQSEKNKLLLEITERGDKIQKLSQNLFMLEQKIKEKDRNITFSSDFQNYIKCHILPYLKNEDFNFNAPSFIFARKFRPFINELPIEYIKDLKHANLIDNDGLLTSRGVNFIKELF